MKAIYYEKIGGADVLQLGELPVPELQAGQVLVRVAAAGVNPIDRRLRSGELHDYFQVEWPIIPGWDFSGSIAALGSDVKSWQVGDEVMGLAFEWTLHGGTYAEYVAVSAESITHKPQQLSFAEAASLPLVSLTAWQALSESGGLQSGQSVLIQAGAGGVGSVAIPMAKYIGAKVYTTARSCNHRYVQDLGTDVAIDYTVSDYVETIKQHEKDGLDMVLESLESEEAILNAIGLVKNGGAVVYLNNEPPETAEIADRNIRSEFLHHRPDGPMLTKLVKLVTDEIVPIPRITVLPMESAADAHRDSEQWRTVGKVVLRIQDV